MKVSAAYVTDSGGRKTNEDTIKISHDKTSICIFVGDGLGGHGDGGIASQIAADVIEREWKTAGVLSYEWMEQAASNADEEIKRQQKLRCSNMKTTMAVLIVEGTQARWMHAGDTRIYRFRNGKLVEQTEDHSVSQMAVLMGEIQQKDIRFHEDRSRVLRALGSDSAEPKISDVLKLQEKDAFLLCTDGFWEYIFENEMEAYLNKAVDAGEWLELMVRLLRTRRPGDSDNWTAAVIIVERKGKKN